MDQKITPFLWFDNNAEEAVRFYLSVFKNSRTLTMTRYDKPGAKVSGKLEGSLMTAVFEIEGQQFTALNGGPQFHFTEAISFYIHCKDQAEVDYYWEKLSEGGKKQVCGWLKDKFGISWQIVPDILGKLMNDPDPVKAQRVTEAMLKMTKIEIDGLKKAYGQF